MANEHNPIALRINKLQSFWKEATGKNKKYKLVRWLLSSENDLPLVNGFYKLESSVHKKIEEILVVMLTDFEKPETFSFQVAKNWIEEYEKALQQFPDLPWKEFPLYKEKVNKAQPINQGKLLSEILCSYQQHIPQKDTKLVVGLISRKVYNYKAFNEWLTKFVNNLPENTAVVLTDYAQNNFYSEVFNNCREYSISIPLGDMDMKGAYNELISQGNPTDPEVQFRTCMLKMGKSAAAGKQKEVHSYGSELLDIGQSSGNKSLWASAHLIYAGFLFRFKDHQIPTLLDKGIKICESLIKNGENSAAGILLQLYAYKASYYSIEGNSQEAWNWFTAQAKLAIDYGHTATAIGACKNAILIAERHFMKEQMTEFLDGVFSYVYATEDNELKATEFPYIANYYIAYSGKIPKEKREEINERMILLFGTEWRQQAFSKIGMSPAATQ